MPHGLINLRDELIEWRTRFRWTQKEAAEYLDVPLRTYQGWEIGHRKVHNPGPVRRLLKLAYWPHEATAIMKRCAN